MNAVRAYNREHAVEYARRWALGRNPQFFDFTDYGGDCTNFVSQCVFAGCCEMNYTETFGWFYLTLESRAPAWTGVNEFYRFITGNPDFAAVNGGVGPYAEETEMSLALPGDVIQLSDEAGDFYHTLIVSSVEDGEILVCGHSNDALDRKLTTYNNRGLRLLHIVGVRFYSDADYCFENLISGKEK